MDTSHCLEYLTAQASRLKYATYNISFTKVRMEGGCVVKPTHAHPPHASRVSANKTATSEWKHGKEGLMNNMDTEASAVFSK